MSIFKKNLNKAGFVKTYKELQVAADKEFGVIWIEGELKDGINKVIKSNKIVNKAAAPGFIGANIATALLLQHFTIVWLFMELIEAGIITITGGAIGLTHNLKKYSVAEFKNGDIACVHKNNEFIVGLEEK